MEDLHETIPHVIVGLCSVCFLIAPLLSKYRIVTTWSRVMAVFIGLTGIAYTVTSFYILAHQHNHHSDLSSLNRWFFSHLKSDLAGLSLGFIIALVINPDFWRFARRPSFHPMAWLESLIKP